MCNLYSHLKGQAALRASIRAMHDHTGNLPIQLGIFPDYSARRCQSNFSGMRFSPPLPSFLGNRACAPRRG